jgi:F-type H+-transporting ATPase subunit delta
MSNYRIANRYAEALMLAAEELKKLKEVGDDLLDIQKIISESHEFQQFLKSPVVKKEKKQQVFEATFAKSVQPVTLQLLLLLAEKEREEVLPKIIEAFFKLRDEKLGFVNVHIQAASELSKQQTEQLVKQFEVYSKKKVLLDVNVDSKLIGGFIARIGDTMFDGSIKRQLELLRQQFTEEITL